MTVALSFQDAASTRKPFRSSLAPSVSRTLPPLLHGTHDIRTAATAAYRRGRAVGSRTGTQAGIVAPAAYRMGPTRWRRPFLADASSAMPKSRARDSSAAPADGPCSPRTCPRSAPPCPAVGHLPLGRRPPRATHRRLEVGSSRAPSSRAATGSSRSWAREAWARSTGPTTSPSLNPWPSSSCRRRPPARRWCRAFEARFGSLDGYRTATFAGYTTSERPKACRSCRWSMSTERTSPRS